MTVTGVEVDGSCPVGEVKYRCCSTFTVFRSAVRNPETEFTTYNVTTIHDNPDVEYISYNVTKMHMKPDVEYMTYNVTKVHANPDVEYTTINDSKVHPGGRGFGRTPVNENSSDNIVLPDNNTNILFEIHNQSDPTNGTVDIILSEIDEPSKCEVTDCTKESILEKCPRSGFKLLGFKVKL
jgi:hypothetical protein